MMFDPASAHEEHRKYQPVAELGQGGMADVFLARMHGPAGFDKLVVLKQIRPHLADDPELLGMFLDEARLAARLSHTNVVQTYEVGQEGERYFIAMEFLDGQPLNRVRRRLQGDGGLPLAMHLRVLADVLAGLHHAHELADFDGTPLGVVHRDVTPQNVFLTYDGTVKVVDFGIAKARCSIVETRVGVIKGKITYMAPEQVRGEPIDRRADVFSVGVMLWEAVTGKRPWDGLDDAAIAHRLTAGDFPQVRAASPEAPDELLRIVERALAAAPDGRYATAAEFQLDLEAYLERGGDHAHTRDLGNIVARYFEADRARLRSLVERQVRDEREENGARVIAPPAYAGERTTFPEPATHRAFTLEPRPKLSFERASAPSGSPPRRDHAEGSAPAVEGPRAPARSSLRWYAGIALAAMLAVGLLLALPPRLHRAAAAPVVTAPAAEIGLDVSVTPRDATVFLDGASIGRGAYRATVRRDGASHEIRVEAPGFTRAVEQVVFDRDRAVTFALAVEPRAAPDATPSARPPTAAVKPLGKRHGLDPRNPYVIP